MDMLHIIIRNQHLVHVYTAASYRHTRRPVLYSCAAENALQIVARLTFFYATPVIAHFPISSIRAFLLPFIAKQSRMPRIAVDAERPASMPEESVHNDFYAQVLICRCLTLALRNSEPSYLAC